MSRHAIDGDGLARVWRHAVLPLLEEHHTGTGIDVNARFGLNAIRSAVAAAGNDELLVGDDPSGNPDGAQNGDLT